MPSILNNVAALQASRQLGITSLGMKQTIERLTTGKRINHASDDAAGLATATSLNADAKIAFEKRRIETNKYYAAAADDGYLDEATNLVMRAVELAAGGNASASEFTSVVALATAAAGKSSVSAALGSITDEASAKTALEGIATARSTIASTMATAQSTSNLYGIEFENKTAQYSNIMDADVGAEVVALTKWQILSQAGTSALSQANQSSQYILGLLR